MIQVPKEIKGIQVREGIKEIRGTQALKGIRGIKGIEGQLEVRLLSTSYC